MRVANLAQRAILLRATSGGETELKGMRIGSEVVERRPERRRSVVRAAARLDDEPITYALVRRKVG